MLPIAFNSLFKSCSADLKKTFGKLSSVPYSVTCVLPKTLNLYIKLI